MDIRICYMCDKKFKESEHTCIDICRWCMENDGYYNEADLQEEVETEETKWGRSPLRREILL
jgi:hypothetical protein